MRALHSLVNRQKVEGPISSPNQRHKGRAMRKRTSQIEAARSLLAEHPGRISKPRLNVLAFMLKQKGPVSHAEIQRELPDLDQVSIYRNLDWLAEKGILERMVGEDGLRRYARATQTMIDHALPAFSMPQLRVTSCLHGVELNQPQLPEGYSVENCSMILAGTCPSCQSA